MSLRIIFAGTPEFSVPTLEALVASEHEVVAVYTQPDRRRGRGKKVQFSPVKAAAVEHNIPVFQPENLRDEAAQRELQALGADLMIVVAYGLILPEAVLAAPTYGCLNIHASLLPRWRGAAPIHRAIEAGDSESGVAIMQMDKGLDTGDVWREATVKITPEMTAGDLHDCLKELGAELLLKTIPVVVAGKEKPVKQEEAGITYAEKISKEEAEIRWEESAEVLMRKIHAFNPFPGAFTHIEVEGKRELLKLFNVALTERVGADAPGTLNVEGNRLFVTAGDKRVLEVLTLQAAGKRRMESTQFLQGNDVDRKVCQ